MMELFIVVVCIALGFFAFLLYGRHQISKLPSLSSDQMIGYTTSGHSKAVITVGIIKDGQASYAVYGDDGKELPHELHTYEIGSLTKTFTAALIGKASKEHKIDINNTIDKYLNLPIENNYPTIKQLMTHTSGYKGYYFASPMVENFSGTEMIFMESGTV